MPVPVVPVWRLMVLCGWACATACPRSLSEADALAAGTTEEAKSDQDEPFFITKEMEAEMVKAGYFFDLPTSHVRTVSLAGMLSQMTDEELKDWPGDMAEQERERMNLAAKKHR